jgi:uncharacterized protein DUF3606
VAEESDRQARDGVSIHLWDPADVAFWIHRFGCTPAELGDAVRAAGTLADQVERYLKRQRPSANDP